MKTARSSSSVTVSRLSCASAVRSCCRVTGDDPARHLPPTRADVNSQTSGADSGGPVEAESSPFGRRSHGATKRPENQAQAHLRVLPRGEQPPRNHPRHQPRGNLHPDQRAALARNGSRHSSGGFGGGAGHDTARLRDTPPSRTGNAHHADPAGSRGANPRCATRIRTSHARLRTRRSNPKRPRLHAGSEHRSAPQSESTPHKIGFDNTKG